MRPVNQVQPNRTLRKLFAVFVLAWGCVGSVSYGNSAPSARASGNPVTGCGYVVGFNELARRTAIEILELGGSAADAFVAATLVEYVIAPGVTSLGGPLGALSYHAETGAISYLDAGLVSVADPQGQFSPSSPTLGEAVLVPGALRGLEALWERRGRLVWAELVEPARRIAADGFTIDSTYSAIIAQRRHILRNTRYGEQTFFVGDEPLAAGALLQQPELASLLARVKSEGAEVMYSGRWVQGFVDLVNSHGGAATPTDLENYSAVWREPYRISHRGLEVYGSSGRSRGGPYVLLGLQALEHATFDLATLPEVDRFEVMIRLARVLEDEAWLRTTKLDDREYVNSRLSEANAREVWQKVEERLGAPRSFLSGSHSFHISVIDPEGNAVTGTNTIYSQPWGDGLFVEGVALNKAGTQYHLVPGPGQRAINAFAQHIGIDDQGKLRFIGGSFGSSLLELQLQLTAALLDEGRSADYLHTAQRFGTFPFDFDHPEQGVDLSANWIDPTVSGSVIRELESRGLKLVQDARSDLGLAAFLVREGEQWYRLAPGNPVTIGGLSGTCRDACGLWGNPATLTNTSRPIKGIVCRFGFQSSQK